MSFPIPDLPQSIPFIKFKYLIYSNLHPATEGYNPTTGEYEEVLQGEISFTGVLLPMSSDDLKISEGAYTIENRKLYTTQELSNNCEAIDISNNKKYKIVMKIDYDGLAQTKFKRYILAKVEGVNR